MHSIRRIVVAIRDPQSRSQPALIKAVQLARALGARLHLFNALTEPLYLGPYLDSDGALIDLEARVKARTIERLERRVERLRGGAAGKALRVTLASEWDAPAYEAVLRYARKVRADLIVAEAHHGRRFLPLLHFNDWELLRRSPVPVLLVKRPGRYQRPSVLAAVDPPESGRRKAGLDESILSISRNIAEALHGRVECVHAYASVPDGRGWHDALDEESARILNRQLAAAAKAPFDALVRRYRIPPSRAHLLGLPPVEAIDTTARSTHSAIVTLGVLSRQGWRRLLIGRTAEMLLDRIHADLLVLKPSGFSVAIAKRPTGPSYVTVTGP
jgi:universal stress protein E